MNYFKILSVIACAAVIIYILYHYYRTNILNQINDPYAENKEFVQKDEYSKIKDKAIKVYYFNADWCPYCKVAKPIWNSFVKKHKLDRQVTFKDINCTNADRRGPKAPLNTCVNLESGKETLLLKEIVKGYPTILMVIGDLETIKGKRSTLNKNNIYLLDSEITKNNLEQFYTGALENVTY